MDPACRMAPYISVPALRMAYERLHTAPHLAPFAWEAAAAAHFAFHSGAPPLFLYPPPAHLAMHVTPASVSAAELAAPPLAAAASSDINKNTSIADLRLKAKKHAEALGL